MLKIKHYKLFIAISFLFLSLFNVANFSFKNKGLFTERFDPVLHKKLYGQSQYILKNPLSEIGDEVVYALAGWEYIHGLDPILLNGEQPPFGKYLIGLSELWFNNSRYTAPIFNILILIVLFFLSDLVIGSKIISSIITYIFSFEKVFIAQLRYAPNLDNIHVFFLLLSVLFFIHYLKNKKDSLLFLTYISLGLVISVKFWITGFLLFLAFIFSLFVFKEFKLLKKFLFFSFITFIPLFFSYFNSFKNGMSVRDFFGTQKYIYSWHSAKLVFDPISLLDFLFLNKWHFMDEIKNAVDWQITWPVVAMLVFITIYLLIKEYINRKNRKIEKKFQPVYIMTIWILLYFFVLSMSTVNARYLFPILPFMYIVSGWFTYKLFILFIDKK